MRGYNIETGLNSTLKKLDITLSDMTSRAGGGFGDAFGLGKQVTQRPWLMLGAALAAGFVIGSLGKSDDSDDRNDENRANRQDFQDWAEYDRNAFSGRNSAGVSTPVDRSFHSGNASAQDMSQPSNGHSYAVDRRYHSGSGASISEQPGQESGSTQFSSPMPGYPASPSTSTPSSTYSSSYSPLSSTSPDSYSSSYSPPSSGVSSSGSFGSSSPSSTGGIAPQPAPGNKKQIPPFVEKQLDGVVETAGVAVRNFIRDTLRDSVPSMRDRIDELNRRDGRSPSPSPLGAGSMSSSVGSTPSGLHEVDVASTRSNDPSLT